VVFVNILPFIEVTDCYHFNSQSSGTESGGSVSLHVCILCQPWKLSRLATAW